MVDGEGNDNEILSCSWGENRSAEGENQSKWKFDVGHQIRILEVDPQIEARKPCIVVVMGLLLMSKERWSRTRLLRAKNWDAVLGTSTIGVAVNKRINPEVSDGRPLRIGVCTRDKDHRYFR